jgi:hypothetical protein
MSRTILNTTSLKHELLQVGGWLAPGEMMAKLDDDASVQDVVVRICSGPGVTPVTLALIAVTMARHIDRSDS